MPEFEVIPLNQALIESASGRRRQAAREYLPYIERLGEGQAGKLRLTEGEKIASVKRRLGDAARLAGKDLTVKRAGDTLYFWPEMGRAAPKKRRGRPPKSQPKVE
jgi:hypothetical protein